MSDKRYILVTGGAGYIGSHTVVELIEQGYEPVIVDDFRNSEKTTIDRIRKIVNKDPIIHVVDVTDRKEMKAVFEEYDLEGIIHFAAYKAVGESVEKPLMYYQNNVDGLINCLELAEEHNVKNFVFSSSCTVYGEPDSVVVTEESPVKVANSPYGATKQICEQIIADLHASGSDMRLLNLRYFNPIGAHPSGEIGELPIGRPNNLLPYITQTAAGLRDELTVFGDDYQTADGTCIRDYIHVVDLALAHIKGFEWLDAQGVGVRETVNLGAGNGVSVLEIIHTFEDISGMKLNWKFGPRRPGDVEQIYADASKAKSLLQWETKKSTKDAVRDAWNWEKKYRNV
jgi:UDP-glucose 4-epimerase